MESPAEPNQIFKKRTDLPTAVVLFRMTALNMETIKITIHSIKGAILGGLGRNRTGTGSMKAGTQSQLRMAAMEKGKKANAGVFVMGYFLEVCGNKRKSAWWRQKPRIMKEYLPKVNGDDFWAKCQKEFPYRPQIEKA